MDHSLYRPEDFACDESYLRYYFKLEAKDIAYWEHWIRTHPEKLDLVMSADQLIGFLSLQLPEEEYQQEYDRFTRAIAKAALLENTHAAVSGSVAVLPLTGTMERNRRRTGAWLVMISVLLVAGSAWLFESRHKTLPASAALAGNTVSRKNTGSTVLDLVMEEGSLARLQPGAELSWPVHFLPGKRELSLNGAASFAIVKNPHRPLFVYCNNLVVEVLGTGFTIITGKHENTVSVSVSSGKVQVYEKKTNAGVVLTPNQKVIYTVAGGRFETMLADHPQLLTPQSLPVVFNGARVYDVTRWLEAGFGIDIDMEDETLYNCIFSGNISGTGFFDALNQVCMLLHARYEVKGARVLIRGAGCDTR